MRLRLANPARVSDFVGFLAVPQIVVERLDNGDIEARPSRASSAESHELVIDLMLRAWNAAHDDAVASIVRDYD